MDDVFSCHTRPYNKSDNLKDLKLWDFTSALAKELPILFLKFSFLGLAFIFELLEQIFFWIFPRPLKNIKGKLAVVTGGSNGIGREICMELARCGCNIACLDIDFDAGNELCTELRQRGVKAHAYKVDVTDSKRIEEVKQEINADLGIVDILVNNAGLMPKNAIRNCDEKLVRRVMDVNVLAHFWTTQTFIEDMIAQHSGHIVAISSIAAFYSLSKFSLYSASKFAVRGFMDALTRESLQENWGVKTLTVFPFITNTRKELIDYVQQNIPSSKFVILKCREPIEVAEATVKALRYDAGYVSIPSTLLFLGKLHQFIPLKIQNLFDKLCAPHFTEDRHVDRTK